jgi:hypothetical protein
VRTEPPDVWLCSVVDEWVIFFSGKDSRYRLNRLEGDFAILDDELHINDIHLLSRDTDARRPFPYFGTRHNRGRVVADDTAKRLRSMNMQIAEACRVVFRTPSPDKQKWRRRKC